MQIMEGAAVALCTQHYKTMIMQHLYDASTYKKLDVNIDMKTHTKFEKSFYTNTVNVSQNLNKYF